MKSISHTDPIFTKILISMPCAGNFQYNKRKTTTFQTLLAKIFSNTGVDTKYIWTTK